MKFFITGAGAVSSIGLNYDENLTSLKTKQTGIKESDLNNTKKFIGAVKLSNEELATQLQVAPTSRTGLLALKAAKEAWGNSNPDPALRLGIISGNSVGGMDLTESALEEFIHNESIDDPAALLSHASGSSTSLLARSFPNVTYANTISTACSSGANAILQAIQLMRAGKIDRAIAGGTDALSAFTIAGFSSLMIYDHEQCKPFDRARKGLNLGEGAGYLLLETESSLLKSKNKVLAVISGYGNANDSFHQTALSPEGIGAQLAIRSALNRANIEPADINYINTHGTATENNDAVELAALKAIFKTPPAFASTKSYTGHTLGASGAIESVYAVMALQEQMAFPSLNIANQLDASCPALQEVKEMPIDHVLSNSFGFGGNQTALIFSKV